MKYSDETLMAYADGELDAETSARVEAAAAADPALARVIARHRALREELRRGFDPVIGEPVPEKLLAAVRSDAAEPIDLRARRHAGRSDAAPAAQSRWSWAQWGAIAASLLIGVLAGSRLWTGPEPMLLHSEGTGLSAGGELAFALTGKLATESDPGDAVRLGPSFRAETGEYCRSFAIARAAGLACREAGRWRVELLAVAEAAATPGETYRMAGAELPKPVREAIDGRIQGEPLDAAGEAAAMEQGWRD
jgi:hypothetical protein